MIIFCEILKILFSLVFMLDFKNKIYINFKYFTQKKYKIKFLKIINHNKFLFFIILYLKNPQYFIKNLDFPKKYNYN